MCGLDSGGVLTNRLSIIGSVNSNVCICNTVNKYPYGPGNEAKLASKPLVLVIGIHITISLSHGK